MINNGNWPSEIKVKLYLNKTAITPRLIGHLKDHKESTHSALLKRNIRAPTYYVEKAFVPFLITLLPPLDSVINSTADYVKRIKYISVNHNSIRTSLDIVSLYPSIDINEIVKIIESSIDSNPNFHQEQVFVFSSTYYRQQNSAHMGSLTSGYLADLKLRPLETEILEHF